MIPLWLALLGLLWNFDRQAAPTDFLVILESVEAITGTQRLLVAGVAPGVCDGMPHGDQDDFCTTLACPGPGTFRITVEALKYKTRSNTVQLRVRDAACTRVEGASSGPGSFAGVPAAAHCRQPKHVVIPPVTVEVPALETHTVAMPRPHTTAPVIPGNPDVIPKQPHTGGNIPRPTLALLPAIPHPAAGSPPLTVTLPTGTPTTVTIPQPPVEVSGVPCP